MEVKVQGSRAWGIIDVRTPEPKVEGSNPPGHIGRGVSPNGQGDALAVPRSKIAAPCFLDTGLGLVYS
jgi:hypothetical protein